MNSAIRGNDTHLPESIGGSIAKFSDGSAIDQRISGAGIQNHIDLSDSGGPGDINLGNNNAGRFSGKLKFHEQTWKNIEQFLGSNGPLKVIYSLLWAFLRSSFLYKARRVFSWIITLPSSFASFVYSKASHWFLNRLLADSSFISSPALRVNPSKEKYTLHELPKQVTQAAAGSRLADAFREVSNERLDPFVSTLSHFDPAPSDGSPPNTSGATLPPLPVYVQYPAEPYEYDPYNLGQPVQFYILPLKKMKPEDKIQLDKLFRSERVGGNYFIYADQDGPIGIGRQWIDED